MPRKCDNWLQTFAAWTLPRSEAPESYHFWAGLYTLASVIKRHVYIPYTILGGWDCYPFIYTMFVAPAGAARKTTTANYAEELLDHIPSVERTATAITKEQLAVKLAEHPESAITIFAPEFSIFIQKSGLDMYDTLTRLFDGAKAFEEDIKTGASQVADKPCVNMLACTTPEWLSENMTEAIIGGGFTSRLIIVMEDKVRRHQMYYDRVGIDWNEMKELETDLITDLVHIASLMGKFEISDDARNFMEDKDGNGWYKDSIKAAERANPRLSGYYQRKPTHLHKIAMLLHLSYSDELILTEYDLRMAADTLDSIEPKMHKAFEHVGKNPHASDMMKILSFIQARGKVRRAVIQSNFFHAATPSRLDELLRGLVVMDKVRVYPDRDDPENTGKYVYVSVEPHQDSTPMGPSHLHAPEQP